MWGVWSKLQEIGKLLRKIIFYLFLKISLGIIYILLHASYTYHYLLQVVRCFEDNDIVHVNGKVDPKSDIDVINLELVFSDLDQVCYQVSVLQLPFPQDLTGWLLTVLMKAGLFICYV